MGDDKSFGAGGTPGGVGQFLAGLVMAVVGAYLLLNQVQVTSFWGNLWGYNAFGLSLVPMLVGIGMLFFNGKSIPGWVLTILGFAIILAGILVNLEVYFRPTSLYNTLLMLTLLAGGIGLIARSLTPRKSA
jgi:hypothetical protein